MSYTTAKFTSFVERVHSKLPSSIGSKIDSIGSKIDFTLTECHRFHTAVQVFRSSVLLIFAICFSIQKM